jgi:hypothetical protein
VEGGGSLLTEQGVGLYLYKVSEPGFVVSE